MLTQAQRDAINRYRRTHHVRPGRDVHIVSEEDEDPQVMLERPRRTHRQHAAERVERDRQYLIEHDILIARLLEHGYPVYEGRIWFIEGPLKPE